MPFLGLERFTSLVYEGDFPILHAVWPPPITAPARIVSGSEKNFSPPQASNLEAIGKLFREDSFDSATRIRRGRFYDRHNGIDLRVFPHPYRPTELRDVDPRTGTLSKQLVVFQSAHFPRFRSDEQHVAIIGSGDHYSHWLVLATETSTSQEQMFTLREIRAYGALPEIVEAAIPERSRAKVRDASQKLADDAFKAGVESVVDRARELANVAFSEYLQHEDLAKPGLELFGLLEIHQKAPSEKKKLIAAAAAEITRVLHSRGKGSQKDRRAHRPLAIQDADLALACAGAILCEFGWATWR